MFGSSSKKQIVGLAVTPNLGLEAAVYDANTQEIVKYGKKLVEYNIASRSIQDIDLFRNAITDLFNELDLSNANTTIFIVLPNVFFGFKNVDDAFMDDEGINALITSEATNSYIFKQEDPVCAWADINEGTGAASKYIAFSAIQTKVLDNIQDAIMDIGGNLVGVESAVTAIPRGVALTGVCNEEIANNDNWNILLINQNNYALFQMCGSRLLDYIEVPFAIMSFEGEDVYPALSSAVAQYLPNYPAKKLVIVSQADNVSAKILRKAVVFNGNIISFDSNETGTEPPMKLGQEVMQQIASSMSMGVLGASAPKLAEFKTLNTLGITSYDGTVVYGTMNIGGKQQEITSDFVRKTSVLLCIILLIIGAVIIVPFIMATANYTREAASAKTQVEELNTKIKKLEEEVKTNVNAIVKQIGDNNVQAMIYYDSLATDIPSNVWLTYYMSKDGKEVGIEGLSLNINDIYYYFKSLKMLAPSSDIKLNKLDVFQEEEAASADDADQIVLNQNDGQKTFTFQIGNTSYTKSFDKNGNKVQVDESSKEEGGAAAQPKKAKSGGGVPAVPDVDANLKEAK